MLANAGSNGVTLTDVGKVARVELGEKAVRGIRRLSRITMPQPKSVSPEKMPEKSCYFYSCHSFEKWCEESSETLSVKDQGPLLEKRFPAQRENYYVSTLIGEDAACSESF
jgi:hypothetical protein